MKTRFNTLDTIAIIHELKNIVGSRVNQVYDIDNKTYLIKLNKPDSGKEVLLFESGIRIHTTKCDWPKNPSPSGFTMKLRKHISNKRIIKLEQVGCDRIIDIQFGSGEVAFHIFIELFNRGNIVLTDYNLNIVSLLRSFNEGDSYHFAVHEKYPIDRARQKTVIPCSAISEALTSGKKNESVKKALLPLVDLGVSFLEHCLMKCGLNPDLKLGSISVDDLTVELNNLEKELALADNFVEEMKKDGPKGYIVCRTLNNKSGVEFSQMIDFIPYKFTQNSDLEIKEYSSFTEAVDDFFSKIESQKIESDLIQKEKEVFKKVNKIRENQASRLAELSQKQLEDKTKADLIMNNAGLVDNAISVIRTAIAAQMSWGNIKQLIEDATRKNDPVAKFITNTKFETNQICMTLHDPFADSDDENKPIEVDVDLSLSAHANAKRYYDHKKHAAIKEKKTLDSQNKALKSAEKKAQEILKTVKTQVSITKSRKVFWFEKFYWFISSENYLVIGGRDQKQNELIVKRYMKAGDLYVHADLQGASSIIIKNPSGAPVPPKTLDEAGHMAVCFSNAWESKILCRAWWVYHHQVSKTAPTGEYLVTGSFMIRGQKNYLLPTHLQLGFSFLFKVDESSAFRHVDERKTKIADVFSFDSQPDTTEPEPEEEEEEVSSQHGDIENPNENLDDSSEVENELNDLKLSPDETLEENLGKTEPITLNLESVENNENINSPEGSDEEDEESLENEQNELIFQRTESTETNFKRPQKEVHQGTKRSGKNVGNDDKKQIQKEDPNKQGKLKRGQKSRLKKIKEKYKDQDEEEQKLRMSLLQSAGTSKKKSKNSDKKNPNKDKNTINTEKSFPSQRVPNPQVKTEKILTIDNEDEAEAEKDVVTELDMLSLLTGQPHPEDEIIFAIPVIAPYSAVLNYKYKVKLIPGLGKRGKSARTAVESFVQSKECTPREKDVMRSVNDQMLSQNFPGKVKLVSAQLKQPKKKK